jgi:ABC-type amino acid transport substrate-binding protein
MITALGMTLNRRLQFNYIQPAYYRKLVVVAVRKNEAFRLLSYDDLKIRRGTSGANISFGQGDFGKLIGVEIATQQSINVKDSFDKLLSGEVDFNLLYRSTAEAWISRNDLWNKVEILPVLAGSNDYYMAWSRLSRCRNQKFLSEFTEALVNSNDIEEFAKLLSHYESQFVEEVLSERVDSLRIQ